MWNFIFPKNKWQATNNYCSFLESWFAQGRVAIFKWFLLVFMVSAFIVIETLNFIFLISWLKHFNLLVFSSMFCLLFFNCYFVALQPTWSLLRGQPQSRDVNHCLCIFDLKVTGSLVITICHIFNLLHDQNVLIPGRHGLFFVSGRLYVEGLGGRGRLYGGILFFSFPWAFEV